MKPRVLADVPDRALFQFVGLEHFGIFRVVAEIPPDEPGCRCVVPVDREPRKVWEFDGTSPVLEIEEAVCSPKNLSSAVTSRS